MSSLLPLRRDTEPRADRGREIVGIDDEAADAVFEALSSSTARAALAALYDEPRTASDLAEHVDTSLQNVRYHLDKLIDADLVEVVDTWYSERGTEMKVYAPAKDSVVVFAGSDGIGATLRQALSRALGAIAVVAVVGILVNVASRWPTAAGGGQADDVGAYEATPAATPEATQARIAEEPGPGIVDGIVVLATTPGGSLFLGGVLAVGLGLGWWYWKRR